MKWILHWKYSDGSSSGVMPEILTDEGKALIELFIRETDYFDKDIEFVPCDRREPAEVDVEAIYQAYPRHTAKEYSLKCIRKALSLLARRDLPTSPDLWLYQRVVEYAAAVEGKDKQYIPQCSTWMNRGHYDDDPAEWSVHKSGGNEPPPRLYEEREGKR